MRDLYSILFTLARQEAQHFNHKTIRTEHIILALLRLPDSDVPQSLQDAGITYAAVADYVSGMPLPQCGAEETLELSVTASKALEDAHLLAKTGGVSSDKILTAVLQYAPVARRMLQSLGFQEASDS